MRLIQLVQCIKCGGGSHLPKYFFFPLLTRLCYLPWSPTFRYGWLPKVFPRCLCSLGFSIHVQVPLFSSIFLCICTWIFNYSWIFNYPWAGPKAQRYAWITCSYKFKLDRISKFHLLVQKWRLRTPYDLFYFMVLKLISYISYLWSSKSSWNR